MKDIYIIKQSKSIFNKYGVYFKTNFEETILDYFITLKGARKFIKKMQEIEL